ncbi:MAG: response regulator transcription factor [Lachnospiraceae bacterium]|nr:response regulator transcription factor [Lachnospiraceae bacterium]
MHMVYVVEDDADIREIERIALTSAGFLVRDLESASGFWAEMKKELPDLVLLDIMLEDEDGLSVLRKMKKDPHLRDIPVIFVTAKTTEFDKVRGLDLGADDYLVKPFGIMELISRVKAVLRRSGRDKGAKIMKIGRLSIDEEKHQVLVDQKPVVLTYKEYELLKYLAVNQNMVISRDKLMADIWEMNFEAESRTLDVHIMTLRKKLGELGSYIRTVKNVGYVLEDGSR